MQSSPSKISAKKNDDGRNITIIYTCVNSSYPCILYIKIVDNLLLNRVLIANLKLNQGDNIFYENKT